MGKIKWAAVINKEPWYDRFTRFSVKEKSRLSSTTIHWYSIVYLLHSDTFHFQIPMKQKFILTILLASFPCSAGAVLGQPTPWKTTPLSADEITDLSRLPVASSRRDLNSHFPFHPPENLTDWEHRRSQIRRDLLVSLGLWPLPPRTPLNPVIHGKRMMDGYSISKVYFESFPGFYVTGNLYYPAEAISGESGTSAAATGKRYPAVLSPHGHFRDGRFTEGTEEEIRKEIRDGAEVNENNARSVLQARCVHLAKLGCIVFHYDMIGYADSQQIPYSIAHGFTHRRPQLEQSDHWGFFSPQAELRLQSIMGLQTWNSIRALDFLLSLPEVDEARIGVTGASGGGTQTFILGAIDDRPAVAFPAVMVSTGMQGGCTCENASHLRVRAGNVDFAAAFAPRPLGLTAANDWTREMENDGYPQLKQVYELYGKPTQLALTARLEFGHNFNLVSRRAMYAWFHQHLALDSPLKDEQPLDFLTGHELSVFDDQHPKPMGGDAWEANLLRYWDQVTTKQLGFEQAADSPPNSQPPLEGELPVVPIQERTSVIRQGWESVLGHSTGKLSWQSMASDVERSQWHTVLIRSTAHTIQTPVRILESPATPGDKIVVGIGLNGFRDIEDEYWNRWVEAGWKIFLPDLLYSGILADPENPAGQNRLVPNGRRAAGYTFGYNRSVAALRASQIIDVCDLITEHENLEQIDSARLLLVFESGLEGIGLLAANQMANPRKTSEQKDQPAIAKAEFLLALFSNQFRFADVTEFEDPMFLPGGVRYGDLPGLIQILPAVRVLMPEKKGIFPGEKEGQADIDTFAGEGGAVSWEKVRIWAD